MDYCSPKSLQINDGQWHSVLITWDGTILKIYNDNILASTSTTTNDNNVPLQFNTTGNTNYIGEVNRTLTSIGVPRANFYYFAGKLKNIILYDSLVENIDLTTILYSSGIVLYDIMHALLIVCFYITSNPICDIRQI